MPDWTAVAVDAALLCSALGIVILGSLAYNPRLWLNDAPPRARALAPPLTDAERRDRNVVAALFLLALVVPAVWTAMRLVRRHGPALSFGAAFGHYLGVFFVFNLFDLLVIDWLVLLVLKPAFLARLSIPGLTYHETVGGYAYHFIAFLKGMGFILALSLLAAGATYWAARQVT